MFSRPVARLSALQAAKFAPLRVSQTIGSQKLAQQLRVFSAQSPQQQEIWVERNKKVDPSVWANYQGRDWTPEVDEANVNNIETKGADLVLKHPDGREIVTLGGIIKQYGIYPFTGLLGAIAFSKELVIIDDAILNYAVILGVFFATYVASGDSLYNKALEEAKKQRKWWNDYNSLVLETTRTYLKGLEADINAPAVLQQAKTEYNQVSEQLYAYQNHQLRVQARDAMIKRLEAIKKREEDEAAGLKEKIVQNACRYVHKQVASAPAADKNLMLEMAIAHLEGSPMKVASDKHPIRKHVLQYVKQKAWEKQ